LNQAVAMLVSVARTGGGIVVPVHPPDPPRERAVPSAWLVPVLTLATFVMMLQSMALGPLLPDIAADLDTSVSLLGQIPAAVMVLASVIGFFAGPLADRFGHNRALLASLIALTISAVGMAVAPGFGLLLVSALFGSLGRAVIQPVAVVIVGDRFSGDRQRRAVSRVIVGSTVAIIAGVPALTTVADALSWRAALLGLAMLTTILIPLISRGLGPAPQGASGNTADDRFWAAYQPLLRHRATIGLLGGTLLAGAGTWVMATYLGAFYADRFDYTTRQIGWVYFVPGATLFLGSMAAGGRVGALPLRPLITTAWIVKGIAIAGLLTLPIPALPGLVLLGVQGITTGVAAVAVVLLLIRESPAGRATTLTLNTVALSLGTALGSTLGGALLAIGDYALLGLASFLLSCGSAALVWFARTPSVAPKPCPATNAP
jgi:predicted MFS family arabinose efflux permease